MRVFYLTTNDLNVKVNPEMPRVKSKAVHDSNDLVLQNKSGLDGLTMEEIRRVFAEELDKSFNRWTSHVDLERRLENKEKKTNQRLVGLRH